MAPACLVVALAAQASLAADGTCASAPPATTPPEGVDERAPIAYWDRGDDRQRWHVDGNRGVGYLEPEALDPRTETAAAFPWTGSSLPLYGAPQGDHIGWLHGGWLLLDGRSRSLPPLARVETAYEQTSLVVTVAREDGWLELLVDRGQAPYGGRVWTHRCRLNQGEVPLAVVLYRDLYLGSDLPLSFRAPVRHALREDPSTDSRRLQWINRDDEIEPLRIVGDWMEVQVERPGKFAWVCAGNREPWAGETFTGWIRWTSADKGTWLAWPTRGC